jgi:hypothetical protein
MTEDSLQQMGPRRAHKHAHLLRKDTDCRRQPMIYHLGGLPISAVFQLRYL